MRGDWARRECADASGVIDESCDGTERTAVGGGGAAIGQFNLCA